MVKLMMKCTKSEDCGEIDSVGNMEFREVRDGKVFIDGKSEYFEVVLAKNKNCECFEIVANWRKRVKVRASEKN